MSEWLSCKCIRRKFAWLAIVWFFRWTAITQLAHHGMLFVPIGYTFGAGMFRMDSIRGGSPYGAGVFAGDGTREPSETELALAEHQGNYMAAIVKRLAQPWPALCLQPQVSPFMVGIALSLLDYDQECYLPIHPFFRHLHFSFVCSFNYFQWLVMKCICVYLCGSIIV